MLTNQVAMLIIYIIVLLICLILRFSSLHGICSILSNNDFKLKSKFNLTFRQLFSYSNYACKLGISQVKEVGIQTITKIEKAQQFPLKAAVENHLRFSPLNLI